MMFWMPGNDYDKPNKIRRPNEQAERKSRKVGNVKGVASLMAIHFVGRLDARETIWSGATCQQGQEAKG